MTPKPFTGAHPDWNEGCWDHKLAQLEDRDTRRFLAEHSAFMGVNTVLDVGSGSGKHARKIFTGQELTCCDLNARAEDGVEKADVLDLPYTDGQFDLVHARRCLTNLSTLQERRKGLSELVRVSRGLVVLADTWEPARRRLEAFLAMTGIPALKLPPRNAGLGGLDAEVFGGILPFHQGLLGAHFYVWTRLLAPVIAGKHEKYSPLRGVTPLFDEETLEEYAVHRIWILQGNRR
jgi:SAM-dependent methyltransferase